MHPLQVLLGAIGEAATEPEDGADWDRILAQSIVIDAMRAYFSARHPWDDSIGTALSNFDNAIGGRPRDANN